MVNELQELCETRGLMINCMKTEAMGIPKIRKKLTVRINVQRRIIK